VWHDTGIANANLFLEGGASEGTEVFRFRLISLGNAPDEPNESLIFFSHGTVNANGEATAAKVVIKPQCEGSGV
jgi:hypothetical protein